MNTRRIYQLLLLSAITATSLTTIAQDAADRDYSAELTRIPPTEPADTLRTFEVVPGYKLELVAAEPLVTSPVAASFDEDGRLYVVEMRDYSEQDKEKLGRVRLLTDGDGNGTFDKSVLFAEGLSWPTAIITYDGGVFVGAAPDIFYLKDTNHDGVADERRVVFTGFGRGNVQGLLNSFTWGLDNRIHVAVSSAGAELQYLDEHGKPTAKPLSLRGRDFSFDPREPKDFIATSGGGQHGMSFDDWGRKFVCSNSDHIQLIMLEDADLARNPYFAAPSPRISIAADGPQADVFRISPVEPWREVRTRLRVKGLVPGPIEGGGRAAGYFTGATGITIYRGNAWPKEDRGLAIVGDVGGNLIHRKRLEPHGLELRAKRIDEKREFVASRDNWFRPVQFLNAPDGALYVLDMYREVIEHPASLPPAIKKHLDLTSGRDCGRIYRIVPNDFKQPSLPHLSTAKTADLVALLEHENGWHRDTAQRLLYEATDRAAIPALHKLATSSKSSLARMHALHALAELDGQLKDDLQLAYTDPDPKLRLHAVRIARHDPLTRISSSNVEGDLGVTLEQLLAIGDESGAYLSDLMVVKIATANVDNAWMRTALLSSLHRGAGAKLRRLATDKNFRALPNAHLWLVPMMQQVARQDEPQDFELLLKLLPHLAKEDRDTFRLMMENLIPAAGSNLSKVLQTRAGDDTREVLQSIITEAWRTAEDTAASPEARVKAIGVARLDVSKEAVNRFLALFHASQPAAIQLAALDSLIPLETSAAIDGILQTLPTLTPAVRKEVIARFVTRLKLTELLLSMIKSGEFSPTVLSSTELDALRKHPERWIRDEARRVLPANVDSPRSEVAKSYEPSLKLSADKTRGAELFKKQCSACHKLGDVGHEIGPNLAAMKARGREAILVNVLDPNREVNPQFVTYAVVTKDGRTLSGMIAAETATSITLKRGENQQDVVLRIDIEELRSTGLSLMPEGLEKQLDQQQLADVIEFIMQSN